MPLQIKFEVNEVEDYLRVDPGQDKTTIERMKKSAMREAEEFLNTDFHLEVLDTATGNLVITPVDAPEPVKDWVLNRIAQKYENRGTAPKPDFTDLKPFRRLPFSARDTKVIYPNEYK